MTKTQRSLALWAALGATLVAASAWALWPKPLTLEVVHPHRDTLRVQRTDQGTTRVRDLYTVSAPTSGLLERLNLEAGDAVTAGQTLASLRAALPVPLDPRRQAETKAAEAAASGVTPAEAAAAPMSDADTRRADREARRAARGNRGES